jgi:hypothetical protein
LLSTLPSVALAAGTATEAKSKGGTIPFIVYEERPEAQSPEACDEQVYECEALLKMASETIRLQIDTIGKVEAYSRFLEREVESLRAEVDEESAWYKQPAIVAPAAFALGILATVFITRDN